MATYDGNLYRVRLYRHDLNTYLDLNDYNEYTGAGSYTTEVFGLWDFPSREIIASTGYQGGGAYLGARDAARQVSLKIAIEAGRGTFPVRNAAHNAARDRLIGFFAEQDELVLEVSYPGSEAGEYWRIGASVQAMPHADNKSRLYDATLICQNPVLTSTASASLSVSLPVGVPGSTSMSCAVGNPGVFTCAYPHNLIAGDRLKTSGFTGSYTVTDGTGALNGKWHTVGTVPTGTTFTLTGVQCTVGGNSGSASNARARMLFTQGEGTEIGGNTFAYPSITFHPTAAKVSGYKYVRTYTVSNANDVLLTDYPVFVPFNFVTNASHIMASPLGADIRVKVNDQYVDRYFANTAVNGPSAGIWFYVTLAPVSSVTAEVIYGKMDATDWVYTRSSPAFDLNLSSNDKWVYYGRFLDAPPYGGRYSYQWNWHNRQGTPPHGESQMVPFFARLGSPWTTQNQGSYSPVNAAGGSVTTGSYIAGYAGHALHHPLGITQIAARGYAYLKNTGGINECALKLRVRNFSEQVFDFAIPGTGNWPTQYNTGSYASPAQWPVGGGTTSVNLGGTWEAVVICLGRASGSYIATADQIAGAEYVEILPGGTPPTVSGGGTEDIIYVAEGYFKSITTGEILYLNGAINYAGGAYNTAVVDCEEQLVTQNAAPLYYAFTTNNPIRSVWMRLLPGDNTIDVYDRDCEAASVQISYAPRRY